MHTRSTEHSDLYDMNFVLNNRSGRVGSGQNAMVKANRVILKILEPHRRRVKSRSPVMARTVDVATLFFAVLKMETLTMTV